MQRNRERGRADSGHSSSTSTALIRSLIIQGNGMPGERRGRDGGGRERRVGGGGGRLMLQNGSAQK